MNRERRRPENSLDDLKLEARVGQLVLKRVFDRLFALIGKTKGDPMSFSCLDTTLDDLFDNLTSSLTLEWEHGNFNHEERLELGKLMADLRGFHDSQRRHLLLRKSGSPKEPFEQHTAEGVKK